LLLITYRWGEESMDNNTLMVVIAVAVVLVAAAVVLLMRRRRTDALRARFGPEYERTVSTTGKVSEAERILYEREKRVASFKLRDLASDEVQRFTTSWKNVQARFVDDPRTAVLEADRLIADVMRARGYPVDDPARQLEDLSVDHGRVVEHYRAGRALVGRHEQGQASTEDLRQAMVHFRALFDELVSNHAHVVRRAS
jgi:hypothetical protein